MKRITYYETVHHDDLSIEEDNMLAMSVFRCPTMPRDFKRHEMILAIADYLGWDKDFLLLESLTNEFNRDLESDRRLVREFLQNIGAPLEHLYIEKP